ncbi:zinc finger and SCAN domain-containing protein 12-like [Limanda limanda]|uniref:zinc finger and SCAN domain-containing protein 12-like n=1 Tax=Limanda limanda TaxID=27771 RepID=UPI0029C79DCD|nr:zinc finger and SCAN domain-containing protein 12-like [Limanda limanda]
MDASTETVQGLRQFISERLIVAAAEILGVCETTLAKYEGEIHRQRRLLDVIWNPEVKLHRTELPQQEEQVSEEERSLDQEERSLDQEEMSLDQEEMSLDQEERSQSLDQEGRSLDQEEMSLDQEEMSLDQEVRSQSLDQEGPEHPQVKEEQEERSLDQEEPEPPQVKEEQEERSQILDQEERSRSLDQEEPEPLQERSLSLDQDERSQSLDQDERSQSLDQEDPEPPQVKEDQEEICSSAEGEQLVLKLEEDEENLQLVSNKEHDQDKVLLNPTSEERPLREPEPNQDQLLPLDSPAAQSQDLNQSTRENSRSTSDKKRHVLERRAKSERQNHDLTVSKISSIIFNHKNDFKCDTCGKVFKWKSRLIKHAKVHTDEQPFSCKTCGKLFKHKKSVEFHMRAHTGEKPFSCKTSSLQHPGSDSSSDHTALLKSN